MSTPGIGVANAISRGALNIGKILQEDFLRKKAEERYQAERAAAQTNQDRSFDLNLSHMLMEAAQEGWTPAAPVASMDATPVDVTAPMGAPSLGRELMTAGSAPRVSLGGNELEFRPQPKGFTYLGRPGMTAEEVRAAKGVIEPGGTAAPDIRDTAQGIVRIGATGEASPITMGGKPLMPKPTAAPTVTFQAPSIPGKIFNPRSGQYTDSNVPAPQKSIKDLPADTQKAVSSASAAIRALDRYQALAESYLGQNKFARAGGQAGVGELAGSAAQLSSAKEGLLLHMKNLAQLGVLSGPDVGIITNLIGDPTSTGATLRNKEATLARMTEARNYIESAIQSIEQTHGITVPRPGKGMPRW